MWAVFLALLNVRLRGAEAAARQQLSENTLGTDDHRADAGMPTQVSSLLLYELCLTELRVDLQGRQ